MNNEYCGYVAVIGRPNVGKSTLINSLIGKKISITSDKPHTTRNKILGVKTVTLNSNLFQIIYIDLPGLNNGKQINLFDKYIYKTIRCAISDADIIVFVVDALNFSENDKIILKRLIEVKAQMILVINKVDKIKKCKILPYIARLHTISKSQNIISISAKLKLNLDKLEQLVLRLLPNRKLFFSDSKLKQKNDENRKNDVFNKKFFISEIVREKIIKFLKQELPHSVFVKIENIIEKNNFVHVDCTIFVEKESQKAIVIGKSGNVLKQTGMQARQELENLFQCKFFLKLFVKVKKNWKQDIKFLASLSCSDVID